MKKLCSLLAAFYTGSYSTVLLVYFLYLRSWMWQQERGKKKKKCSHNLDPPFASSCNTSCKLWQNPHPTSAPMKPKKRLSRSCCKSNLTSVIFSRELVFGTLASRETHTLVPYHRARAPQQLQEHATQRSVLTRRGGAFVSFSWICCWLDAHTGWTQRRKREGERLPRLFFFFRRPERTLIVQSKRACTLRARQPLWQAPAGPCAASAGVRPASLTGAPSSCAPPPAAAVMSAPTCTRRA